MFKLNSVLNECLPYHQATLSSACLAHSMGSSSQDILAQDISAASPTGRRPPTTRQMQAPTNYPSDHSQEHDIYTRGAYREIMKEE